MSDVDTRHPGLGELLGFRTVEVTADRTVLRWTIGERLLQGYGIVHGGVYCAAIEQAARVAATQQRPDGTEIRTLSTSVEFLRAARSGELTATAVPVNRTGGRELWYVEVRDEAGRRISVGTVRLLASHPAGTSTPP